MENKPTTPIKEEASTNQSNHVSWKPGTLIYPLPAALISCGASKEEFNLLTISWMGTICSNPPMCYISVRKERHSYDIIKRNGEFVINLTNEATAYAADWCGVRSGKDYNKFEEMKLTPVMAEKVNVPYVKESPLAIECMVKEIIPLGSHDMFIADVVNIMADSQYIDEQTGEFKLSDARLIAYSHGHYYKMGEEIGKFGWTVKKNQPPKG
jgi:flavin reductase (DIM6/NTAB) family NADH-FMN oxidoreductase RutF